MRSLRFIRPVARKLRPARDDALRELAGTMASPHMMCIRAVRRQSAGRITAHEWCHCTIACTGQAFHAPAQNSRRCQGSHAGTAPAAPVPTSRYAKSIGVIAAPWRVVNIGAAMPIVLTDFVAAIEAATGLRAKCNFMAMQQGDVPVTFADTSLLRALTGFAPKTLVEEGVNRFVAWYRDYFGV
jgi:hypothetical protein